MADDIFVEPVKHIANPFIYWCKYPFEIWKHCHSFVCLLSNSNIAKIAIFVIKSRGLL